MSGFETIFSSWSQFLATCAVLVVAEGIYVMFGFGSGLIAVGGLAMMLPDVRDVAVLLMLVNLPVELSVVVASRRTIEWRGVLWLGLGVAVGIPLGTAALRYGEPTFILTLLGAFLVAVGVAFLLLPEGRKVRIPVWAQPPTGLLSGVLSGMFSTGGPPLIFYYQLTGAEKGVFRGNLMALFLVGTCIHVPSYLVGGLVTEPRVWSALACLPAVAIGAVLGHLAHIELSERTFRRLVSVLLAIIGGVLLIRR
jgi:uncharacterized membrane protein YfcA